MKKFAISLFLLAIGFVVGYALRPAPIIITKSFERKFLQCEQELFGYYDKYKKERGSHYKCLTEAARDTDRYENKIKNLESTLETCEEKYHHYPEKNLHPETVEEKEPTLGDLHENN